MLRSAPVISSRNATVLMAAKASAELKPAVVNAARGTSNEAAARGPWTGRCCRAWKAPGREGMAFEVKRPEDGSLTASHAASHAAAEMMELPPMNDLPLIPVA